MTFEIETASSFISTFLRECPDHVKLAFTEHLQYNITKKYQGHWNPQFPLKGSAYRAITCFGKIDPLILSAGESSGLDVTAMKSLFVEEFVIWVDPGNVSYRVGSYGNPITIWKQELRAHAIPIRKATDSSPLSRNSSLKENQETNSQERIFVF